MTRILIVDESVTDRREISRVLNEAGYSTEFADSSAMALRMLAGPTPPAAVVTDVHMSDSIHGEPLVTTILEQHPTIPVACLSSGGAPSAILASGAICLRKHAEESKLAETVDAMMKWNWKAPVSYEQELHTLVRPVRVLGVLVVVMILLTSLVFAMASRHLKAGEERNAESHSVRAG